MRRKPDFEIWIEEHLDSIQCSCGCGEFVIPKRHTYYSYCAGQRKFFVLGHQMRREHHGRWQGGLIKVRGYIWVLLADRGTAAWNGYTKRAHLVMEQKLGRPLRAGERVHHIDGDKTNDEPRNLQVVTYAEHAQMHSTVRLRDSGGKFISAS